MSYTVHELAKLSGVNARTLHYYDAEGLLVPERREKNNYRLYGEKELLLLQQILFFRELEVPLADIKHILSSPSFDVREALHNHRKHITAKKVRLERLIETIDKTMKKIDKKKPLEDSELYGNFTKEEAEKYAKEAKERWGDTEAYKQSQERVKKLGKEGLARVLIAAGKLTEEIATRMKAGDAPVHARVQILIAQHYDGLRAFYEPNVEIYRGLAEMYVADERFAKNYEKVAKGLARFMSEAMMRFVEIQEKK